MKYPNRFNRAPRPPEKNGNQPRPSFAHELRRVANALEELVALARKAAAK